MYNIYVRAMCVCVCVCVCVFVSSNLVDLTLQANRNISTLAELCKMSAMRPQATGKTFW